MTRSVLTVAVVVAVGALVGVALVYLALVYQPDDTLFGV